MANRSGRLRLLRVLLPATAALLLAVAFDSGQAQRISDVRGTRHNLSASSGNPVRATTEQQVCVFCHTPHAATPGVNPLWNRRLSGATYTVYTSGSLDANAIQIALDQPGGSSKLCLSCHDGTLAIGSVNVLNGQGGNAPALLGAQSIAMQGTGTGGAMPPGSGVDTGFTRNLGIDLRNDHPISLNFTTALADRDGELRRVDANQRWPATTGTIIGVRAPGYRPQMPLEPTGAGGVGQMQCATCHDPHVRDLDPAKGPQKFLRTNRFQEGTPTATHNPATDIICVSCHDKNGLGGSWAFSAHANPLVATQTYTAAAAALRDFPASLPVWKASCMNCHDTHTVSGARRLTREGTDSVTTPKSGGNPAIEQTCYQCHTSAAASIITPTTTVPNIQQDFLLARRMPITNVDQAAIEPHDIRGNFSDAGFIDCSGPTNRCGADFIEPRALLGAGGNLNNRHAECTDCHNPHRVVKFRDFRGNPPGNLAGAPDPAGTHRRDQVAGYTPTNIASGVLRGTWGVEPVYPNASFFSMPTSFVVKRGDPGTSTTANVTDPYVTREYQICLKCHSNYGYDDNNVYPIGNRPALGRPGLTPAGTNGLQQYTNQAREFQAPITHRGQVSTTDSGASALYSSNNHRSWHPVMDVTGRTGTIRGAGTDISLRWALPWRNAVGSNTMYCSDCHGSNVTGAGTFLPDGGENGNPWGPHGSNNNFILKGTWDQTTGTGNQATGLCFKCHDYASYATASGARTGFFGGGRGDLHQYHADKIGRMRCTWCHVAVPHGWKNKALLVNLNDVGPEAGLASGTEVRRNTTAGYTQGPYYLNAMNKIRTFAPSGQWAETNCGSRGGAGGGNGRAGRDWMRDSSENCANPP